MSGATLLPYVRARTVGSHGGGPTTARLILPQQVGRNLRRTGKAV